MTEIPETEPKPEVSPQALPDALIVTVGISADPERDVVEALAEEIRRVDPAELILIASTEGEANARRITKLAGREGQTIVLLDSAHDLEETFLTVNRAVEQIRARGIPPERTAINFTSGTKMMSSGAVLSAVFKRCMELRYVAGSKDEHGDRRFIQSHPAAVFALQDIRRSRNLARELRFKSALELLKTVDDSMLDAEDCQVHCNLIRVADAYDRWNQFHPEHFLEIYAQIEFGPGLLRCFQLGPEALEDVTALASQMVARRIGKLPVVELYNNGIRRLVAGEVDDALLRLYRAMEMYAQWILLRDYEIETTDVATRKIPPRDRVGFEALRSVEDGIVRIGLRKAYDLLIILETTAGEHYKNSELLREFLARRSDSVLAHGMMPVNGGEPEKLFSAVADLFKVEIDDFEAQSRRLQFPWIVEPVKVNN